MGIRGWVRVGDAAACGGAVAEGSSCDVSDGVPYAFEGAKMSCSGNCVIAEGYATSVLSNGKAQVLDGQRTTGRCTLVSTLNGADGVADES